MLGVDLGTNTKNTMSSKNIGLHAQIKITLLGSIVNMNGGHVGPLNEHKNRHFDDE